MAPTLQAVPSGRSSADLSLPLTSVTCACGAQIRLYRVTLDVLLEASRRQIVRVPGTAADGHRVVLHEGRIVDVECRA